jgi:hypothetical protein
MPKTTRMGALLLALCTLAVSMSARADEAADTAAARQLGGDGIILADAGNCEQAVEKLRRAEELHHAPTTAARLGECEIAIGRVVVGTERLQRLLREQLPPNAPEPFVEALARARRVLERALPRIGALRVSVRVPQGTKVQVSVDGERLSEALLDADRPSDPGHHTVVASAVGFFSKTEEVTVGEGDKANVVLELSPDRRARSAARLEPKAVAAGTTAPTAPSSGGAGPAPIVAFTMGGFGLGMGIAGWLVVALDAADLSKNCNANRVCPQNKQSELDSAKTWATVSTVGFGVAGAGIGAGLMLLLLGTHHESPSPSLAKIHPVVGPLYAGCEGAL